MAHSNQTRSQPTILSAASKNLYRRQGLWGDRLIVDWLDERAAATPDKAAIVETEHVVTYKEVVRRSENLATSLLDLGVGSGDVVAIQSPNWAELPIVHFATDRIGAIFMPISEGFREREIQHLLERSQARVVFWPERLRGIAHRERIDRLRPSLHKLEHVIDLRTSFPAGRLEFEALSAHDGWRTNKGYARLRAAKPDADAPSHVMVSSGTTGLPRCSLFSDNNTLVKLLHHYAQAVRLSSSDVAAALAPAGTGATGYNYPILATLLAGGTSVLLDHWSSSRVQEALELIERYSCTLAVVVPTQLAKLVEFAESSAFDLKSLRAITNSGAKLPPATAAAAERLFKCKVQTIYGTSEAGATAMTSIEDPDDKRQNTVGRPLVGQEVLLCDHNGKPVPPGEAGEVCWRGANKSYGFLHDFESSQTVWDPDGWLRSGDLGRIDEHGYLSIVGRKKDMIVRGGQNINPGAIEEILLEHPAVAEVAVVALVDSVMGERIAACVVVKGAKPPTLAELKELVLSHGLAAWHQPELLALTDELPRNAGGKIDKRLLTQLVGELASMSEDGVVHHTPAQP